MTRDRVCTNSPERGTGTHLLVFFNPRGRSLRSAMDEVMGDMRHGARSLPPIALDPVESQASLSIAVGEEIHGEDIRDDGASEGFNRGGGIFPVCTEATSGSIFDLF